MHYSKLTCYSDFLYNLVCHTFVMYNYQQHHKMFMTRKEFYAKWVDIEDKIPSDYINRALQKDAALNANRLQNVRYGKTLDGYILNILEEIVNENQSQQ